jgi:hypothetical protein
MVVVVVLQMVVGVLQLVMMVLLVLLVLLLLLLMMMMMMVLVLVLVLLAPSLLLLLRVSTSPISLRFSLTSSWALSRRFFLCETFSRAGSCARGGPRASTLRQQSGSSCSSQHFLEVTDTHTFTHWPHRHQQCQHPHQHQRQRQRQRHQRMCRAHPKCFGHILATTMTTEPKARALARHPCRRERANLLAAVFHCTVLRSSPNASSLHDGERAAPGRNL